MFDAVAYRLETIKLIFDKRLFRWIFPIWAAISLYDTAGSQLAPEWLKQKLPNLYGFIVMTSGWLPWWAWVIIGLFLIAAAAVEYATRLHLLISGTGTVRRTVARLRIQWEQYGIRTIAGSDNIKHLENSQTVCFVRNSKSL